MIFNYQEYNSYRIDENLKIAKEYLIKREAKKLDDEYKKFVEEEKEKSGEDLEEPVEIKVPESIKKKNIEKATKKVDSDQTFKKLGEIVKDAPNYALPFARFVYDQDVPLETVEEIFRNITGEDKNVISKLPKTIDEYSKTRTETKRGDEILADDILELKKRIKLEKFFKTLEKTRDRSIKDYQEGKEYSLPIDEKWVDSLRKLPEDLIKKLEYSIETMVRRKGEKGFFHLSKASIPYMTGRKDGGPKDYVEYVSTMAEAEGQTIYDLEDIIREQGEAAASVIYLMDNFLITSIRSPEAQKVICARVGASWCINTWSFWNYAQGRIQYAIFDFNRKESDPRSIIGITCNYDGNIYGDNVRDMKDDSIQKGKTLADNLRAIGVPEEGVKATVDSLSIESYIRKTTDKIFAKGSDKLEKDGIVSFLDELNRENIRDLSSKEDITEKYYQIAFDATLSILKSVFQRDFEPERIIRYYMNAGIYSELSLATLRIIGEDKITPQQREAIKKTSKEFLYEDAPVLYQYALKKAESSPKALMVGPSRTAKYILDNKEEVEKIINSI